MNPSKRKFTVLKQIVKHIPRNLVPRLASKHGVDKQSRDISPWSHVLSLLHAQLSHALSLNDVCDTLRNHAGALKDIRAASPPSRNGLSNANRKRNPAMAEELFWSVLLELKRRSPRFWLGHGYSGVPYRFKRAINAVDSTTIKLFANSMSWAKHRRRKAAAKMHLRLDLQTFLPRYALVKAASTHDSTEAVELCAGLSEGEIAVFDKAYCDFSHLALLNKRKVFWVTRLKDNIQYRVVGQHRRPGGRIIKDVLIELTGIGTSEHYPEYLRLVEAIVEVDGRQMRMTFITNNMHWASSSVCGLYKCRWGIEVFFKEIKQTLQIADFLGYNENAVKWQIWTALLTYVLLRYIHHVYQWPFTFPRLFTVIRGVLWSCFDLAGVLESCGTAGAPKRMRASPDQVYLPGFAPG